MANIQPYQINIPSSSLSLLQQKLSTIRLPVTNPDGWTDKEGVPLTLMTRLLDHWRDSYLPRWREREAALNRLPMFTTSIDTGEFGTLNIHFMWEKSKRPGAIPLLFVHGWPGCFLEGSKLLDILTEGGADDVVFDIVVPSLPNYGFSDGINKKGFHIGQYATVLHNLMTTLGYDQYVTQGGDWGSMITRQQARLFPESVRGVHVNMVALRWYNLLTSPLTFLKFMFLPWTKQEKEGLNKGRQYTVDGDAYYKIQHTRPLTTSYLLSDSPVALLAYVWEKLREWSQDAEKAWTDDELLDWISIYWFSTAGPGASVATYHEAEAGMKAIGGSYWEYEPVPLGITQFPGDIVGMPKAVLGLLGPVVFTRWADYGGHFAGWEAPDEIAKDLRVMFGKGSSAFGVVAGRNGLGEGKKDT